MLRVGTVSSLVLKNSLIKITGKPMDSTTWKSVCVLDMVRGTDIVHDGFVGTLLCAGKNLQAWPLILAI